MAENSEISWTDHTFNPWIGCTKISPACENCYAESWAIRSGKAANVVWGGDRRRTAPSNWAKPLKWNEQAEREGRRMRVFCASLADVFDNQVPPEWRRDLFNLILSTPHLDWLLLTKRIGNAARMIEDTLPDSMKALPAYHPLAWPWQNVWLGATICNQEEADRDIPKLLAVPARVRFVSIEPMLGPVDLQQSCTKCCPNGDCFTHFSGHRVVIDSSDGGALVECICSRLNGLHWVIAGGESGPNARPMHPDWARSLRNQCAAAGAPFHFKQWGEWVDAGNGPSDDAPYEGKPECWASIEGGHHDGSPPGVDFFRMHPMYRVGVEAAGRLLDGVLHDAFPEAACAT